MIREDLKYPQLRVDVEPRRLLVVSEPYVVYSTLGYQCALDVFEKKHKKNWSIYIGAISLSRSLQVLVTSNNGSALGLEFWIRKESTDRKSKYLLTE